MVFFSNLEYVSLGPSAIEDIVTLPDDMLIDYMHQVFLGVVKTILTRITNSKKFLGCRNADVSAYLIKCRVPGSENKRQLRRLETLKYWKAAEFKLFLFYGFTSLYGTLSLFMFIHFFLLSSAVRYLVEPLDKSFIDVAERLIKIFQKLVPRFYGEAAQTFNMHSLGHLADQVKMSGPLASLSCMPFEAAHYHLKRAIGPITSASLATKLAVKRNQRRFFRRKFSWNCAATVIGSLKLFRPTECLIEIEAAQEIFVTSSTFEIDSKTFFCHGSKCSWHSDKTCVHFVEFVKNGTTCFGQLMAIFADSEAKAAAVHIKEFRALKSLSSFLSKLFEEAATPIDDYRTALDLEEGLELIDGCYDHNFLIQRMNSDVTLVDVKNLTWPCIVRDVAGNLILSKVCGAFERD